METKILASMKDQLAIAENTLKEYRLGFTSYVQNHIHEDCFERNAMQDLFIMQEKKAKIETLKLNIDILENSK
jgi:hypothetical protein